MRERDAGYKSKSALIRFWSKAEIGKASECWNWVGAINGSGYGSYRTGKQTNDSHRMAYQLSKGTIAPGMQIDHLCRNRKCQNPNHLEEVTQHENMRRGIAGWQQLAKTHCPQGHAYSAENTYLYKRRRSCRICGVIKQYRYKARKLAGLVP